jgi:hypothetical protein
MKKTIVLAAFILTLPFIVNIPDAKLLDEANAIIASQPQLMTPQKNNDYLWLVFTPVVKDKTPATFEDIRIYRLQ